MATSLFNGMAGLLNGTFGGSVTIYPSGGGPVEIVAVVRSQAIDLASEYEEPIVGEMTVLKAQKSDVADLVKDDRVEADGRVYTVEHRVPASSPADDRFETFALEVL